MPIRAVTWSGDRSGHVLLVDQTRLPGELCHREVRTVDEMVDAIYRLVVRGAPAIGLAAAYGVVLGTQDGSLRTPRDVLAATERAVETLAKARPTAVNLFTMLERMRALAVASAAGAASGAQVSEALFAEAQRIAAEIEDECRTMGELAAHLVSEGAGVLTHCNAGALATIGIGTALAPLYVAAERGVRFHVWADETRPLLQGARLTAWELAQAGIDVTILPDNAAAGLLASGRVNVVFVGADRIARNGDVCNKVGTYGVAVLAREHRVPFYVVAPLSTFDAKCASGADIPIEQRPAAEVTHGFGASTAPEGVAVYNPAFDVTPASYVTGIVTERGILEAPDRAKLELLLRVGQRVPAGGEQA